MNNMDRAFIIAICVAFCCGIVVYCLQPVILDAYFNNQQVKSAYEYNSSYNDTIFGNVIVIEGLVTSSEFEQGYFEVVNMKNSSDLLYVYRSEKLNCIPMKGSVVKVAGAWASDGFNERFYGVWVVGGCRR